MPEELKYQNQQCFELHNSGIDAVRQDIGDMKEDLSSIRTQLGYFDKFEEKIETKFEKFGDKIESKFEKTNDTINQLVTALDKNVSLHALELKNARERLEAQYMESKNEIKSINDEIVEFEKRIKTLEETKFVMAGAVLLLTFIAPYILEILKAAFTR